MADITFEQVKNLIEQMPSTEVERLRTWLNGNTNWGQHLVELVNQFELDEADQMNIDDPETWVREYYGIQTQKRNPTFSA